jgi:cysteine synthase
VARRYHGTTRRSAWRIWRSSAQASVAGTGGGALTGTGRGLYCANGTIQVIQVVGLPEAS